MEFRTYKVVWRSEVDGEGVTFSVGAHVWADESRRSKHDRAELQQLTEIRDALRAIGIEAVITREGEPEVVDDDEPTRSLWSRLRGR